MSRMNVEKMAANRCTYKKGRSDKYSGENVKSLGGGKKSKGKRK